MDDYYGFASFFAQISTKRLDDPREVLVFNRASGDVRHPVTNRVMGPKYLGGTEAAIEKGADRRVALAKWIVDDDNPYFSKNIANRLFAHFFGRGIVDPVDDVRTSNPPSHPLVLEWIARRLRETKYNFQTVVQEFCKSETYNRSAAADESGSAPFAAREPRRLPSETLLDAIDHVTGVPTKYRGLPDGATALDVRDGVGNGTPRFLEIFGRSPRTSSCSCDRRNEPTLTQALHLINGPSIESKILDRNGRIGRALSEKLEDEEILEDVFLAAYSRYPTKAETQRFFHLDAEAKDRKLILSDLMWVVLNSKEFLFNH
jgi:hypothetical protein